ncbi:MAG: M28 family peptidase [Saprospiraceae bacterium]|nr:M28 family peptidase [Saprospiraceae bacterium]
MGFIKNTVALLATTMLLFMFSCKHEPSTTPSEQQPNIQPVAVPKFERDSALAFVKKQVDFGPRVPNTDAHKRCKEWLVAQFTAFGLKVTEQPFSAKAYTGKTLNGVNIIAQHKPEATKRIFIAAHWDSRHIADSPLSKDRQKEPILGADDGGSGVGVLLEIARVLQASPAELGVDLVLFDAEDHGDDNDESPNPNSWCLGSQHWSRNLVPSGYSPKYGILLDMVGAKGARFTKEGVSMNFAPAVMNKVWKTAQNLGYTNYFVEDKSGPVTDDHYFVNTIAKLPMIDIIGKSGDTQTGFGAHWHTHNDNIDIIDVRALRAVGQTLLEVIYQEAAGKF